MENLRENDYSIENLEAFFSTESTNDTKTNSIEEKAYEAENRTYDNKDLLTIKEKVFVGYQGVTNCCNQERVNNEVSSALKKWVEKKLFEYRDLRWVRYGCPPTTIRCVQTRDVITGKRRCTGRGTINAYIQFRRL